MNKIEKARESFKNTFKIMLVEEGRPADSEMLREVKEAYEQAYKDLEEKHNSLKKRMIEKVKEFINHDEIIKELEKIDDEDK